MDEPRDDPTRDAYATWRSDLRRGFLRRGLDPTLPELVLLLPDLVHLGVRLLGDPRVPGRRKVELLLVAVYLVSPLDLIPEILVGPIGYVDDAALVVLVLERLFRAAGGVPAREHWAGGRGAFRVLWGGLGVVTRMLNAIRGRGSSPGRRG